MGIPTWIAETVASEIKCGEGGVEENEVCNGLGAILLTNLAPAGLQDIDLQCPDMSQVLESTLVSTLVLKQHCCTTCQLKPHCCTGRQPKQHW